MVILYDFGAIQNYFPAMDAFCSVQQVEKVRAICCDGAMEALIQWCKVEKLPDRGLGMTGI